MNTLKFSRRCLYAASNKSIAERSYNQNVTVFNRGLATVAVDDSKLPLKGYRVLDMTRVLAGVSQLPSSDMDSNSNNVL